VFNSQSDAIIFLDFIFFYKVSYLKTPEQTP